MPRKCKIIIKKIIQKACQLILVIFALPIILLISGSIVLMATVNVLVKVAEEKL